MSLRRFFQEYFTFNKRERNGILVLCTLIAFLILYLNIQQFFVQPPSVEVKGFQSKIDAFLEEAKAKEQSAGKSKQRKRYNNSAGKPKRKSEIVSSAVAFPFNPNTASHEDWLKLGLEEWQIKAITKYRQKAGDFKTAEDVKRLKAIRPDQFARLESYMQFPVQTEKRGLNADLPKAKRLQLFELNQATADDLMKIRGIGPVLSGRIVKLRKLLGGFIAKDQILEVYGIEDSLFRSISPQLFVDKSIISRININKAPAEKFSKHPYIRWNVANAIVNYRDQHGPYKDIADIKNTDVVSDELFEKILPYLSLD